MAKYVARQGKAEIAHSVSCGEAEYLKTKKAHEMGEGIVLRLVFVRRPFHGLKLFCGP